MQTNYKEDNKKFIITIICLCFALLLAFIISLCIGRYPIKVSNVFKWIFGGKIDNVESNVLEYLRLPRTLVAILVGCALATSGVIYQSIFNNKLVSPDLLGVSSGASVGACLAILLGFSTALISIFAFIMGFIAVLLTILIAKSLRNRTTAILILSGIAVGGLMSSFVGLLKYLADDELKLAEMTFWLLGDLSKVSIKDFYVVLPIVAIGCTLAVIFSWKTNILSLGKKEAITLGVNYNKYMVLMIVIATMLTAISVAVSGTIGWLGLVIPNFVRLLFGNNNKKVIPISILIGAVFMVLVDMIARSIAPNEIPLSVITGIIGTPIFIFAIFKRRKEIK